MIDQQLIEHRQHEQQCADHEAHLRNPDRDHDHAAGNVVEREAFVGEARGPPAEIGDREHRDRERDDLQHMTHPLRKLLEQQRHAHEVAMLEGMRHRQKSRRRSEPGHDVVDAADAPAGEATDRRGDHQHEDQEHRERGKRPGSAEQRIQGAAHEGSGVLLLGRCAVRVAAESGEHRLAFRAGLLLPVRHHDGADLP